MQYYSNNFNQNSVKENFIILSVIKERRQTFSRFEISNSKSGPNMTSDKFKEVQIHNHTYCILFCIYIYNYIKYREKAEQKQKKTSCKL